MARLKFAALAAAAAIAVAACGGSATQSPAASQPAASQPAASQPAASETPAANAPKEGGTLVVALSGDINRTDPSLVDDANSTYVESQVLETLVTLKPGTGDEIIPALATEWSVSDDGLSYTFKIRDGVKFHDGTALDAAAVKANFDRWMTIPKSYVDLGYTYYIDTVVTGKIAKVEAPDASTVVVTLNAPNSAFLVADDADAVRHLEPQGARRRQRQRPRLQGQQVRDRRPAGDGRHRPVHVQGVGPGRPRDARQEPGLLEQGGRRPVPRPDHVQADRRHDGDAQRHPVGRRRPRDADVAGRRPDRQGRHQPAARSTAAAPATWASSA